MENFISSKLLYASELQQSQAIILFGKGLENVLICLSWRQWINDRIIVEIKLSRTQFRLCSNRFIKYRNAITDFPKDCHIWMPRCEFSQWLTKQKQFQIPAPLHPYYRSPFRIRFLKAILILHWMIIQAVVNFNTESVPKLPFLTVLDAFFSA